MKTVLLTCLALTALACDDADVQAPLDEAAIEDDQRPLRPGPCSQHDAISDRALYHQYEFDDAGRMVLKTTLPTTSATYESWSRAWTYSEAGFLTQICDRSWESGLCERWTVDADGTPLNGEWEAWVIHPIRSGIITFDAEGRRAEVTEWALDTEAGEPELVLTRTFTYAADTITTREDFGHRVRVTEERLDADGRIVERRVAPDADAAFELKATYVYGDGRLSDRIIDGVRTTFTYDRAGNLLRRTGTQIDSDEVVEDVRFDYGCFDRPELDLSSWAFDEGHVSDERD